MKHEHRTLLLKFGTNIKMQRIAALRCINKLELFLTFVINFFTKYKYLAAFSFTNITKKIYECFSLFSTGSVQVINCLNIFRMKRMVVTAILHLCLVKVPKWNFEIFYKEHQRRSKTVLWTRTFNLFSSSSSLALCFRHSWMYSLSCSSKSLLFCSCLCAPSGKRQNVNKRWY